MEIDILSLRRALIYTPYVSTYGIRIVSPFEKNEIGELVSSPLYKSIRIYEFEDKSHANTREKLFNENIAAQMIRDFIEYKERCECLMIHCNRGLNRSPAVGMAFNLLFQLGQNPDLMQAEFPEADMGIYEIMKRVGERIKREGI